MALKEGAGGGGGAPLTDDEVEEIVNPKKRPSSPYAWSRKPEWSPYNYVKTPQRPPPVAPVKLQIKQPDRDPAEDYKEGDPVPHGSIWRSQSFSPFDRFKAGVVTDVMAKDSASPQQGFNYISPWERARSWVVGDREEVRPAAEKYTETERGIIQNNADENLESIARRATAIQHYGPDPELPARTRFNKDVPEWLNNAVPDGYVSGDDAKRFLFSGVVGPLAALLGSGGKDFGDQSTIELNIDQVFGTGEDKTDQYLADLESGEHKFYPGPVITVAQNLADYIAASDDPNLKEMGAAILGGLYQSSFGNYDAAMSQAVKHDVPGSEMIASGLSNATRSIFEILNFGVNTVATTEFQDTGYSIGAWMSARMNTQRELETEYEWTNVGGRLVNEDGDTMEDVSEALVSAKLEKAADLWDLSKREAALMVYDKINEIMPVNKAKFVSIYEKQLFDPEYAALVENLGRQVLNTGPERAEEFIANAMAADLLYVTYSTLAQEAIDRADRLDVDDPERAKLLDAANKFGAAAEIQKEYDVYDAAMEARATTVGMIVDTVTDPLNFLDSGFSKIKEIRDYAKVANAAMIPVDFGAVADPTITNKALTKAREAAYATDPQKWMDGEVKAAAKALAETENNSIVKEAQALIESGADPERLKRIQKGSAWKKYLAARENAQVSAKAEKFFGSIVEWTEKSTSNQYAKGILRFTDITDEGYMQRVGEQALTLATHLFGGVENPLDAQKILLMYLDDPSSLRKPLENMADSSLNGLVIGAADDFIEYEGVRSALLKTTDEVSTVLGKYTGTIDGVPIFNNQTASSLLSDAAQKGEAWGRGILKDAAIDTPIGTVKIEFKKGRIRYLSANGTELMVKSGTKAEVAAARHFLESFHDAIDKSVLRTINRKLKGVLTTTALITRPGTWVKNASNAIAYSMIDGTFYPAGRSYIDDWWGGVVGYIPSARIMEDTFAEEMGIKQGKSLMSRLLRATGLDDIDGAGARIINAAADTYSGRSHIGIIPFGEQANYANQFTGRTKHLYERFVDSYGKYQLGRFLDTELPHLGKDVRDTIIKMYVGGAKRGPKTLDGMFADFLKTGSRATMPEDFPPEVRGFMNHVDPDGFAKVVATGDAEKITEYARATILKHRDVLRGSMMEHNGYDSVSKDVMNLAEDFIWQAKATAEASGEDGVEASARAAREMGRLIDAAKKLEVQAVSVEGVGDELSNIIVKFREVREAMVQGNVEPSGLTELVDGIVAEIDELTQSVAKRKIVGSTNPKYEKNILEVRSWMASKDSIREEYVAKQRELYNRLKPKTREEWDEYRLEMNKLTLDMNVAMNSMEFDMLDEADLPLLKVKLEPKTVSMMLAQPTNSGDERYGQVIDSTREYIKYYRDLSVRMLEEFPSERAPEIMYTTERDVRRAENIFSAHFETLSNLYRDGEIDYAEYTVRRNALWLEQASALSTLHNSASIEIVASFAVEKLAKTSDQAERAIINKETREIINYLNVAHLTPEFEGQADAELIRRQATTFLGVGSDKGDVGIIRKYEKHTGTKWKYPLDISKAPEEVQKDLHKYIQREAWLKFNSSGPIDNSSLNLKSAQDWLYMVENAEPAVYPKRTPGMEGWQELLTEGELANDKLFDMLETRVKTQEALLPPGTSIDKAVDAEFELVSKLLGDHRVASARTRKNPNEILLENVQDILDTRNMDAEIIEERARLLREADEEAAAAAEREAKLAEEAEAAKTVPEYSIEYDEDLAEKSVPEPPEDFDLWSKPTDDQESIIETGNKRMKYYLGEDSTMSYEEAMERWANPKDVEMFKAGNTGNTSEFSEVMTRIDDSIREGIGVDSAKGEAISQVYEDKRAVQYGAESYGDLVEKYVTNEDLAARYFGGEASAIDKHDIDKLIHDGVMSNREELTREQFGVWLNNGDPLGVAPFDVDSTRELVNSRQAADMPRTQAEDEIFDELSSKSEPRVAELLDDTTEAPVEAGEKDYVALAKQSLEDQRALTEQDQLNLLLDDYGDGRSSKLLKRNMEAPVEDWSAKYAGLPTKQRKSVTNPYEITYYANHYLDLEPDQVVPFVREILGDDAPNTIKSRRYVHELSERDRRRVYRVLEERSTELWDKKLQDAELVLSSREKALKIAQETVEADHKLAVERAQRAVKKAKKELRPDTKVTKTYTVKEAASFVDEVSYDTLRIWVDTNISPAMPDSHIMGEAAKFVAGLTGKRIKDLTDEELRAAQFAMQKVKNANKELAAWYDRFMKNAKDSIERPPMSMYSPGRQATNFAGSPSQDRRIADMARAAQSGATDPSMQDIANYMVGISRAIGDYVPSAVEKAKGVKSMLPEDAAKLHGYLQQQARPQLRGALTKAIEMGKASAGFTMLNYQNRRYFDDLLGVFAPYTYFMTRNGWNSMKRAAMHPGKAGIVYRANQYWEQNADYRGRQNVWEGDKFTWDMVNPVDMIMPFFPASFTNPYMPYTESGNKFSGFLNTAAAVGVMPFNVWSGVGRALQSGDMHDLQPQRANPGLNIPFNAAMAALENGNLRDSMTRMDPRYRLVATGKYLADQVTRGEITEEDAIAAMEFAYHKYNEIDAVYGPGYTEEKAGAIYVDASQEMYTDLFFNQIVSYFTLPLGRRRTNINDLAEKKYENMTHYSPDGNTGATKKNRANYAANNPDVNVFSYSSRLGNDPSVPPPQPPPVDPHANYFDQKWSWDPVSPGTSYYRSLKIEERQQAESAMFYEFSDYIAAGREKGWSDAKINSGLYDISDKYKAEGGVYDQIDEKYEFVPPYANGDGPYVSPTLHPTEAAEKAVLNMIVAIYDEYEYPEWPGDKASRAEKKKYFKARDEWVKNVRKDTEIGMNDMSAILTFSAGYPLSAKEVQTVIDRWVNSGSPMALTNDMATLEDIVKEVVRRSNAEPDGPGIVLGGDRTQKSIDKYGYDPGSMLEYSEAQPRTPGQARNSGDTELRPQDVPYLLDGKKYRKAPGDVKEFKREVLAEKLKKESKNYAGGGGGGRGGGRSHRSGGGGGYSSSAAYAARIDLLRDQPMNKYLWGNEQQRRYYAPRNSYLDSIINGFRYTPQPGYKPINK
jgi:hypothetical protein